MTNPRMLTNILTAGVSLLLLVISTPARLQKGAEKSDKLGVIQSELKADVPKVLCLDERFATGGQPTDAAYAKLAAAGFQSVLNLRTASEGVDIEHERELVEKFGLHFINIPVKPDAPRPEAVAEFFAAVKDDQNQPMLIHCASANRVGAFWMIYRVLEEKWPEDKALEEAGKIGLTSPVLKKFAQDYIASHKKS